MNCRHCQTPLSSPLVDLGSAPLSNGYLTESDLRTPEIWYPLRVLICENCWLVQTQDIACKDELFHAEYAYFSSYSRTWLAHAERYVSTMVERFALCPNSHVVEIAANDGYLLQYMQAHGIPCTGVEPTASTAAVARNKGIPIIEDFFDVRLAEMLAAGGLQADLIIANNVLAHVPNINAFVEGFGYLLKPQGVATFEFPHLFHLLAGTQFDTIYHEHFSYLSLIAVERIFQFNGLTVFDVEELPTHGGSLRVFAQRLDTGAHRLHERVAKIMQRERESQLDDKAGYAGFQDKTERVKNVFLYFLLDAKTRGRTVVAYGAAAKGNTLLNFAGVRPDLLSYVVDRNPAKQGKFLPGSRIPIVGEDYLRLTRPDAILILPWNLKTEIIEQLSYARDWGAQFVTAVPQLAIF
jgi:SAM-dependent methyltransferase